MLESLPAPSHQFGHPPSKWRQCIHNSAHSSTNVSLREAGDLRLDVHVEMESSAPQILQHAQHLKEVRGILKDTLITAVKAQKRSFL